MNFFETIPALTEAVRERRIRKGRKQIAGEAGRHYSLETIYRELNSAISTTRSILPGLAGDSAGAGAAWAIMIRPTTQSR